MGRQAWLWPAPRRAPKPRQSSLRCGASIKRLVGREAAGGWSLTPSKYVIRPCVASPLPSSFFLSFLLSFLLHILTIFSALSLSSSLHRPSSSLLSFLSSFSASFFLPFTSLSLLANFLLFLYSPFSALSTFFLNSFYTFLTSFLHPVPFPSYIFRFFFFTLFPLLYASFLPSLYVLFQILQSLSFLSYFFFLLFLLSSSLFAFFPSLLFLFYILLLPPPISDHLAISTSPSFSPSPPPSSLLLSLSIPSVASVFFLLYHNSFFIYSVSASFFPSLPLVILFTVSSSPRTPFFFLHVPRLFPHPRSLLLPLLLLSLTALLYLSLTFPPAPLPHPSSFTVPILSVASVFFLL